LVFLESKEVKDTKKASFGVEEAFTRIYIYKERVCVRTCARYSAAGASGSAAGASGAAAGAGASRNSPVVS